MFTSIYCSRMPSGVTSQIAMETREIERDREDTTTERETVKEREG